MTYLQMLESIEQLYPNYGRTQIGLELNRSYKEFVSRTQLLTASYMMPTMATWDNLDIDWESYTISVGYTLQPDVDIIYDMTFYDKDGKMVNIDGTTVQGYEIKHGKLVLYLNYKEGFTITDFTEFQNVQVEYYKIPDTLTNDTDVTEIDTQFDDAIISRTCQKFAEKMRALQEAVYYKREYYDWIKEGRKKAFKLQDGMPWEFKIQEYPGG